MHYILKALLDEKIYIFYFLVTGFGICGGSSSTQP